MSARGDRSIVVATESTSSGSCTDHGIPSAVWQEGLDGLAASSTNGAAAFLPRSYDGILFPGDAALAPTHSGGEQEPRFVEVRRKEAEIDAEFAAMHLREVRGRSLLSVNAKTTMSLDFPIGHTCHPTQLCAAVCYASRPGAPAAWKKSLRKRLRNLRYLKLEETGKAIDRLSREFARKRRSWAKRGVKLDFLRVNGTGDLFPALIPALNGFAARNPDVLLWIVTRRFDLAALIEPRGNVYLQLSLDATTAPMLEEAARQIVATNPRAYLSYLRTTPDNDTRGAAIVFNATDELPYNGRTDCPVDAGKLPLGNERGVGGTACSKCRKCFSQETLARQRDTLDAGHEQLPLVRTPTRDGGISPLVHADLLGRLHLKLTGGAERAQRQGAAVSDSEPDALPSTTEERSVDARIVVGTSSSTSPGGLSGSRDVPPPGGSSCARQLIWPTAPPLDIYKRPRWVS